MKKYKHFSYLPFVVLVTLGIIYTVYSYLVSKYSFKQTDLAYYNYLLSSLFHGRLFLTPFANATDLVWFKNNWYMYWGFGPTVFILPFYLIARTKMSDVIYTLVAGIINIFLYYFVLKSVNISFQLKKKINDLIFIVVNFALISPHFYLSLQGRIWHTNQIIAVFYLLLFLLLYFKVWQKFNKLYFCFSIIFLNLAFLSRYTMIFYFALLIPLLVHIKNKYDKKITISLILLAGVITSFFFILMFAYNYFRFGNIFENGYRYTSIRSSENVYIPEGQLTSMIDFKYFSHNFYIYFLNPIKLNLKSLNIIIDKEGNNFFSVYPLTSALLLLFSRTFFANKNVSLFIITALTGVILPITLYLLFYLGTGWAQFGLRYLLDIFPLLYILIFFVSDRIPSWLKLAIIIYGVYVNLNGAILFYQ